MRNGLACLVLIALVASALPAVAPAAEETPETASPRLDDRDHANLERGPYTRDEIVGGGLLGTLVGFGTGHAAQGRWKDTGWIYTAGEGSAVAAVAIGVPSCTAAHDDDDSFLWSKEASCVLAVGGIAGGVWLLFRIAETIDVWAHPQIHNRRFRKIEEERARQAMQWTPWVAPDGRGGASAGLALRF